MRIYPNAGFGEPLNPAVAAKCQSIGHGIRTGLACNDEHDMVRILVKDTLHYFPEAIFVVAGWDWREEGRLVQKRNADLEPYQEHFGNQCLSLLHEWKENGGEYGDLWVEFGNELDGSRWKRDLASFYRVVMHCYRAIRKVSKEVHVITGSTMNFNKEFSWKRGGYEVLDEICELAWPADTVQGLHPYRGGGRFWPSFDTEDKALLALRRVLRNRPLAITEMGWASGTGHTDEVIAGMMREEIAMWQEFGALVFCPYQIQDGPSPQNVGEGGFGAFTNLAEGLKEKPLARMLMEARNA